MRKSIVAVGFIGVLQVFASDASAADRASAMTASRSATGMALINPAPATDTRQGEMQASLSDATERKMYDGQEHAVNSSFARPKPIRIYFFFGGR